MWSRREIKAYAKNFLRQNYWKSFLVVLITLFLIGGTGDVGKSNSVEEAQMNINNITNEEQFFPENFDNPSNVYEFTNDMVLSPLAKIGIGVVTVSSILMVILLLTLGFVAEVGQSRFFLDGFKGDVNIGKLFSGFNSKEYLPIVKAQALAFLYIFLWTFVFIIPGIIKQYQYRYVPYLLAEDSTLSPREALDKSKELTRGHKWDIFVLDLSFILWNMLGIVTFGIAPLFVAPYVEATNARLYTILSDNSYDDFIDYNY